MYALLTNASPNVWTNATRWRSGHQRTQGLQVVASGLAGGDGPEFQVGSYSFLYGFNGVNHWFPIYGVL